MAKRNNGMGTLRKRKDGRWEGRFNAGVDENGKKQVICSDENWKYSFDGPVRSADLFLGETYDARRYDGEPSEIEYDDKKWLQVRTHTMENPIMLIQHLRNGMKYGWNHSAKRV